MSREEELLKQLDGIQRAQVEKAMGPAVESPVGRIVPYKTPDELARLMTTIPRDHIMQFFAYAHLKEDLQAVSRPFCELAEGIEKNLPRNPERTVALRKLLEAKDAAVRAFIAVPS